MNPEASDFLSWCIAVGIGMPVLLFGAVVSIQILRIIAEEVAEVIRGEGP